MSVPLNGHFLFASLKFKFMQLLNQRRVTKTTSCKRKQVRECEEVIGLPHSTNFCFPLPCSIHLAVVKKISMTTSHSLN